METGINSRDILITIIQSLTQLLGIIGALVLITFQFQRKNFSKLAFLQLLNFGSLWETFLLYIGTIIYAVISLISLSNPAEVVDIKFTLVSIVLFVICLVILLPLLKSVLENSKAKKQAQNLLNKIRYENISIFRYYDRATVQEDYLSALEQNPIVLITDGAISLLIDGDVVSLTQVVVEVNNKLLQYLKEKDVDKRTTMSAFLYFYRNLSVQALELKNERVLETIIKSFVDIHFFAAEEKFRWSELLDLNELMSEVILKGIRLSLNRFIESSLFSLQWIQGFHMEKNIPKPSELWDFYGGDVKTEDKKNSNSDNDLQWNQMSEDYIRMFFSFLSESISNHQPEIWAKCLRRLVDIGDDVIKLQNINDKMKSQVLGSIYFWAREYTNRGIDEGLWKYTVIPFPFNEFTIGNILEDGKEYGKELLLIYSESLYDLSRKGVLNGHNLNEYVAMGRGFTRKLKGNRLLIESFLVVIATLDKIREELQNNIKTDELKIYTELFDQVKSLDNWLVTYYPNKSLRQKVNKTLNQFDIPRVKNNVIKRHFIDWPGKLTKGKVVR